jgi:hypothetical protein
MALVACSALAPLPDRPLGKRRIVARRLAPAEPTVTCQFLYIDAEQLSGVSAREG